MINSRKSNTTWVGGQVVNPTQNNQLNPYNTTSDYFSNKLDFIPHSLSISADSSFVILATTRELISLKFTDTDSFKQKYFKKTSANTFSHPSQPEVGVVECNPVYNNIIASSSSNTVLVWNIEKTNEPLEVNLSNQHIRPVTALNWNHQTPNLLASCSTDSYINVWDFRADKKQNVWSLNANLPVYKIKWNRLSDTVFATGHDKVLKIWDLKMNSKKAMQYITCHDSKISNLDFDYTYKNLILTTSQDKIKMWHICDANDEPELTLRANTSINSANFMPFGPGFITSFGRADTNINIYSLICENTNDNLAAKHEKALIGHQDLVRAVGFRKLSDTNYNVVSISADRYIKIWSLPQEQTFALTLRKLARYNCGNFEEKKQKVEMLIDEKIKLKQNIVDAPKNFIQEMALIEENFIKNVIIQEKNVVKRHYKIKLRNGIRAIILGITFPDLYPYKVAPKFEILPPTVLINTEYLYNLNEQLIQAANQSVAKNQPCMMKCFTIAVNFLDKYKNEKEMQKDIFYKEDDSETLFPTKDETRQNIEHVNYFVPYPKTIGFAMNCYGHISLFSSQKYNFRRLNERFKKVYSISEMDKFLKHAQKSGNIGEKDESSADDDFIYEFRNDNNDKSNKIYYDKKQQDKEALEFEERLSSEYESSDYDSQYSNMFDDLSEDGLFDRKLPRLFNKNVPNEEDEYDDYMINADRKLATSFSIKSIGENANMTKLFVIFLFDKNYR